MTDTQHLEKRLSELEKRVKAIEAWKKIVVKAHMKQNGYTATSHK